MRKSFKKLLCMFLTLAMVAGMSISVLAEDSGTSGTAVPKTTTQVDTPSAITSVEVTPSGGTAKIAQFYTDDNSGSQIYIRALLDNDTTVAGLKSAKVVITLRNPLVTLSADGLTFTSSGATKTCESADLLNKAYTLTIGGVSYILAAGINPSGSGIPSGEPGMISNVTVGGTTGSLTRNIVQSSFMGNPYLTGAQSGALEWTSINYYVSAGFTVERPSTMSVNYTKSDGTTAQESLDMSTSVPSITVDGVKYYFQLGFSGEITVNYAIDFQEFENTRLGENYLNYATESEWNTAMGQKSEIMSAWQSYFGNQGQDPSLVGQTVTGQVQVQSGTTVMSEMQKFLNAKFPGKDTGNTSTYISSINELGEFDIGSMSGWMFLEGTWAADCEVPMVGAADYKMNVNNATITWFYVTDYMNHF